MPDAPLADQQVILTIPASFDEVAREPDAPTQFDEMLAQSARQPLVVLLDLFPDRGRVALEGLERVQQLHRSRHHRVVLHALVVVVHLLEHGMDFMAQSLGFLAEFNIFQAAGAGHAADLPR